MPKRIIHPNGTGISVIIPALESGLTIEEIAKKDTPDGVPFLIIDTIEVPADRINRTLWTADFSNPNGYGGAV